MVIEPFGLHDNLMLVGGVIASSGCIVSPTMPHAERYTSLIASERCVAHAEAMLPRWAGRASARFFELFVGWEKILVLMSHARRVRTCALLEIADQTGRLVTDER